jgi:hypothetical protein
MVSLSPLHATADAGNAAPIAIAELALAPGRRLSSAAVWQTTPRVGQRLGVGIGWGLAG